MMFTNRHCHATTKYAGLLLASLISANSAYAESPKNWGIQQTAAPEAWRISRGNKKIIVAIIDTGIDATHPALKNNLWVNPSEIPNGIDDDGNGFIDDIHGWSFTTQNAELKDLHGHGTHIAGIITGLAPEVSLMILKYYDPGTQSSDNLKNTVKAIEYAVKMNANIINYSGGGGQKNSAEEAAIAKAKAKGILFVAAAGNEKSNADEFGFYPASYELSNIISVTAIDKDVQILKSSNYGRNSVDIAAPGKDIYSTLPGGRYGYMTGTSQATAFVTGAAALVMAKYKTSVNLSLVLDAILTTNNVEPHLSNKTRFNTQLNIYRSLAIEGGGINAFGQADEPAINNNAEAFIRSN